MDMNEKILAVQSTTEMASPAFMSFQACLHIVKEGWKSLFSELASSGVSGDAVAEEVLHLRNANLVLRKRLKRHSTIARELYQVLAGEAPPSLASSVDDLMESVLRLSEDMKTSIIEAQMASASMTLPTGRSWREDMSTAKKSDDGLTSLTSLSFDNPAVEARCLVDFWRLADFKLRHAASTVAAKLEDLAPGGLPGAEVALLRVAQLERDLEVAKRKAQEKFDAAKSAADHREKMLTAEIESLKTEHTLSLEKINAEHREYDLRQQTIFADELSAVAADFDAKLQQMLQQVKDDASLSAEQFQRDRANAIEKLRAAMVDERRRHEKTVQRLTEETAQPAAVVNRHGSLPPMRSDSVTSSNAHTPQAAQHPPLHHPQGRRKSSAGADHPTDLHNHVTVYSEGSNPWTDESKETLAGLLKEKHAEVQMQQATHAVVSKARVLEWESILKDTIARYEGELQSCQAFLDKESTRSKELLRQLELANHKVSTLTFELKNEQAGGKERLEELERQAKEDISLARGESAMLKREVATLDARVRVLEVQLQEQAKEAEVQLHQAQQELLAARDASLLTQLAKIHRSVQCDLGGPLHKPTLMKGRPSRPNSQASSRRGSFANMDDFESQAMLSSLMPTTADPFSHSIRDTMHTSAIIEHLARPDDDPPSKKPSAVRPKHQSTTSTTRAPSKTSHPTTPDEANAPQRNKSSRVLPAPSAKSAVAVKGNQHAKMSASPVHKNKQRSSAVTSPVSDDDSGSHSRTMTDAIRSLMFDPRNEDPSPQAMIDSVSESKVDSPVKAQPLLLPAAAAESVGSPAGSPASSRAPPAKWGSLLSPDVDAMVEDSPASLRPNPHVDQRAVAVDEDHGFDFKSSAHAILSNEVLREAVETLPSATGALEDKINAATKLPPTLFGVIPAHVTAKRFYRAMHSMAVICDFALPGTSGVGRVTNEARLREAVPEMRNHDTPAVSPVPPLDIVIVMTFLQRNMTPTPLPPVSEQFPGENRAFTVIGAETARLASYVRSQGIPALLDAVSWDDLERWRFHDRDNQVAVPPVTVQQFFNGLLELLHCHRRYRIYCDKHIKLRQPSLPALVNAEQGDRTALDRLTPAMKPRPPLAISAMSYDGPTAKSGTSTARPIQHLVDAVAIMTQSSSEHIKATRIAHRRWKAVMSAMPQPEREPPPTGLSGSAIAPSPRHPSAAAL